MKDKFSSSATPSPFEKKTKKICIRPLPRSRNTTTFKMFRVRPFFLSECVKRNGFTEHRDMFYSYVLWVLFDGSHVAFIHKDLMLENFAHNGETFGELVISRQGLEEPCKMISRPFIKTLGYKPDYVVITDSIDGVPSPLFTTCGYTMHTMLQLSSVNPNMEHIRTLAEGPGEPFGQRNQLGRLLSSVSSRLEAKGFLSDPKYFPDAQRDAKHIANGMTQNELKLRKMFNFFS